MLLELVCFCSNFFCLSYTLFLCRVVCLASLVFFRVRMEECVSGQWKMYIQPFSVDFSLLLMFAHLKGFLCQRNFWVFFARRSCRRLGRRWVSHPFMRFGGCRAYLHCMCTPTKQCYYAAAEAQGSLLPTAIEMGHSYAFSRCLYLRGSL